MPKTPASQQARVDACGLDSNAQAGAAACGETPTTNGGPRLTPSSTRKESPSSRFRAMGPAVLGIIPELHPVDQRRGLKKYPSEPSAHNPHADMSARAKRAASLPAGASGLRSSNPLASPFGWGTIAEERALQPAEQVNGRVEAGQQAGPQGLLPDSQPSQPQDGLQQAHMPGCCLGKCAATLLVKCFTKPAAYVVSIWMGNRWPVRRIDFIMGVTTVAAYTLCLILCLAIPAAKVHWHNVPPRGVVAQYYKS